MSDPAYFAVTNGYPGADVWVTIYYLDITGRQIGASGWVFSGQAQTWHMSSLFDQYWVRCESFTNINGSNQKFSDTTAQVPATGDFYHPYQCTLLPETEPTGTYIAPGAQPAGNVQMNFNNIEQYLVQAKTNLDGNTTTATGYLAVDPTDSTQVVIESSDGVQQKTITWIKSDTPYGSLLTSLDQEHVLCGFGTDNTRVHLVPSTPLNQRLTLWTIGGNSPNNVAVRPYTNSDQNLNVFGDGPYNPGNPVGTWSWGGGAPNEVWTFIGQS